jgi:hypothetical protein
MHQTESTKHPDRGVLCFRSYLLGFPYMSPNGFPHFKPTTVELGPRKVEKSEVIANDESPDVFKKYNPDEMNNLDGRVFNRLPPWAEDLNHPVYKDLPEEVVALMDRAVRVIPDKEASAELIKVLDKRWDEWIDTQP